MEKRGKFIVFEGLDGCGKTTHIFNLKRKLDEYGFRYKEEREPSDGIIGLITRGAVKKKIEFQQETLALLFAADRLEHIVTDILPALEAGVSVLCDRYVFSSLAFQSAFLPMETVLTYNRHNVDTLMPDLTIFLDVPPEVCTQRIMKERTHMELFEGGEETKVVRENFFKAFELLGTGASVKIVDGNKREGIVFDKIWDCVKPLFMPEE